MGTNDLSSGMFINYVLSLLLRKIVVPSDYHNQIKAVKEITVNDVSGMVDSLTDFAVESATVDFSIETKSDEFNKILKKWLETINIGYNGKIPIGLKELEKEYYKERWKASSFMILKLAKWEAVNSKIVLPTKMFFVDGESIEAQEKTEGDSIKIDNYDYYLGKIEPKNKLENNVIFSKPYARWFDKYSTPFLIKRGIYYNWKVIQSIKQHGTKVLNQIIPYMLKITKGSEALALQGKNIYNDEQLKGVIADFQALMDEIKGSKLGDKNIQAPIRATHFDESIEHIIPNISAMFERKLFAQAERNILAGLGFIDIAEAYSDSRRDSILNPKGFIKETKSGVNDFKQILTQVVYKIKEKNIEHTKYMNEDFYITHSPITAFMTDKFKNHIRLLYDRGRLSSQTAVEMVAETDFRTEVFRRERETKEGIEKKMYPVITRNQEDKGMDNPTKPNNEDVNGKPLPPDKTDPNQKQEYDIGKKQLEGSPYPTLQSLPPAVKKLSLKKQRTFMKTWNRAYYYKLAKTGNKKVAETYAFKVAWAAIKSKKSKKKEK